MHDITKLICTRFFRHIDFARRAIIGIKIVFIGGIAQVLRSGWYNKVHIKSNEAHYDRALLTARKAVLRKCLDLEAEIRGLFKVLFGIRLPSHVKRNRWDEAVRPIIEADERLAFGLKPMLEARLVLYQTYLEMERRLRAVTNKDPVCMRLQW